MFKQFHLCDPKARDKDRRKDKKEEEKEKKRKRIKEEYVEVGNKNTCVYRIPVCCIQGISPTWHVPGRFIDIWCNIKRNETHHHTRAIPSVCFSKYCYYPKNVVKKKKRKVPPPKKKKKEKEKKKNPPPPVVLCAKPTPLVTLAATP